eukprot:5770946-Pyramimonas_sp.AAC.1
MLGWSTQVEAKLSLQIGEMQDLLLLDLQNLEAGLQRIDGRVVALAARLGEGGDGFDSNDDGVLDIFELMVMLNETGTAGPLALRVWELAQG